jgi:hypothetical protein
LTRRANQRHDAIVAARAIGGALAKTASKPAQSANPALIFCRNMLRSSHGLDPEKDEAPNAKAAHGSRRERLRAQGLRPVQHWVPDLRDPRCWRRSAVK